MLNSKQRAYLRGLANKTESVFQVGKSGATPEIVESVNEALEKRELVKGTVLNNCLDDVKYIASVISERTHSDIVQIIGKKFVLYRRNDKKPVIELDIK